MKASGLFSEMLAAEMQTLERTAQLKAFNAGHHIFQQGERGDGLYIIAEGRVAITLLLGQGQSCVLASLGPGDFFGEMALLDDQPRSATATAEVNTRAYFILRGDLWRVLKERPALVVTLLGEFSKRMRNFNVRYAEQVLQADRLNLVGRLAHTLVRQFKGPLSAIRSAAETAAAETSTPQLREAANASARKQVERMNNLINEFLEFTRGGSSTTVLAKANYADFVRPLIEEIRSDVAVRSVILEMENDPPDVNVLVDPARMSHLFQNLVYSACDGMPHGGRIKVRFAHQTGEVVTEIEDSGPGVSREVAEHLFEPFAQYARGKAPGLELAICARIIEDHHGRILARSDSRGGTTFVFNLPLARTATPRPSVSPLGG